MKFDWWTLSLQTINLLVLLWVLRHFLFKPVQQVIERRQQELRKASEEAMAQKRLAESERLALDGERAALAASQERALTEARDQAHSEAQSILAQAAADAAELSASEREKLQRERTDAEARLRQAAAALARGIVARLLERMPPEGIDRLFLPDAYKAGAEVDSSGNGGRQHDAVGGIELVSAHPIPEAAQAEIARDVQSKFGNPITIRFSCDPALLAGVELRFRHIVIRNNWAADLQQITGALADDATLIP